MKTNIFTLLISLLLSSVVGIAQGVTFTSFLDDTSQVTVCQLDYTVEISPITNNYTSYGDANLIVDGSNILNSNLTAEVQWGDGSTSTHTGTAITSGTAIAWSPAITHTYSTAGIYTFNIDLYDPISSDTINYTQDVIMGGCYVGMYASANLDCDGDGVIDSTNIVPQMLLIGSNGNTYSAWSIFNNNFYGVLPDTYTIVVDPNWLAANNWVVQAITPNTITTTISGNNNITSQIILNCDSTQLTSNCLNGTIFCDNNNNGILDSTEIPVGGAPLVLYLPNGSSHSTTADPNGLYSFSYTGLASGGFVSVDQTWMSSNGYYNSGNFIDTISDLSCTNNPILNIPIICDTNALSVGCVNGYVYCDDNGNGILDSSEVPFYNAPVTLNGLGGQITVYTDSTGYYSYTGWQLSGGTVLVSLDQSWQVNNSAYVLGNGAVISNLNCANNNQADLALNCNSASTCADLWSSVTPWIGYYQNTTNSVWFKYGNYGSGAPGNYTVSLDYPSGVTPVLSSINNPNYTISGNTITWTLNSNSTYMYNTDVIYFNTPAGIPDSTFHVFSSAISSATADCDSSNNYSTLGMLVGVSYDPNDKSVNQPTIVNPAVQDEYTYVIRFQNTGTAPAQDVYILDSLSTNLDWTTFELLEATHPIQLIDMGNGIKKFDFPQIWLPDSTTNEPASHGHVVYRIKELPTLSEGDIIENTAYIYFDQNAPIITNTTLNINTVGLGISENSNLTFTVFPNPAKSSLNIESEDVIQSIRIVDLSGKLVYENKTISNLENINIEGLSSGLYNIEVRTINGVGRRLFVKA
ncbi:MAG: T9SS type A sorting domain-containing protein [Crocinitomicaceae bacterium]